MGRCQELEEDGWIVSDYVRVPVVPNSVVRYRVTDKGKPKGHVTYTVEGKAWSRGCRAIRPGCLYSLGSARLFNSRGAISRRGSSCLVNRFQNCTSIAIFLKREAASFTPPGTETKSARTATMKRVSSIGRALKHDYNRAGGISG